MQFVASTAFLAFVAPVSLGCTAKRPAAVDSAVAFMAPDVGTDTVADTGTAPSDASARDASEPGTGIGVSCMSDADCDVFCATEAEEGWRDGYCTSPCSAGGLCPEGSACVFFGDSLAFCFDLCDPSAEERQCRAGYGCADSAWLPEPVCLGGCTDDTDCALDQRCNPSDEGACYDPSAAWGDACRDHSECPDEADCRTEERSGWPRGMCAKWACDLTIDHADDCPAATVCIPSDSPDYGWCLPRCETDEGCRAGYACRSHGDYPGRLACLAACDDDSQCSEGRACSADGTCE